MGLPSVTNSEDRNALESLVRNNSGFAQSGTENIQRYTVRNDVSIKGDEASGFDMLKFNKCLKTLVDKGTTALAEGALKSIPGAGLLTPAVSSLLDQLLESPPDENAIINQKLDKMSEKLESMAKQMDQDVLAQSIVQDLTIVRSHAGHIDAWWESIRKAYKRDDEHEFSKIAEAVGSRGIDGAAMQLSDVHKLLVGTSTMSLIETYRGASLTAPMLNRVCALHYARMIAEDDHFDYDVIKYDADIKKWFKYVNDLQVKGSALLTLYQTYRLLSGADFSTKNSTKTSLSEVVRHAIQDIQEEHNVRITAYKDVITGEPIVWKASQILYKASKNVERTPDLYTLQIDNSDKFMATRRLNSYNPTPRLLPESLTPGDLVDFNYFFGLLRKRQDDSETGLWRLCGSRHRSRFEDPSSSVFCRDDDDKTSDGTIANLSARQYFGLFGRNHADAKIIPLSDEKGQARIRFCFLDKGKHKVLEKWDFRIEPLTLSANMAFVTVPDPKQSMLKIVGALNRMSLWINNLTTDHILVLQDIVQYDEDFKIHFHGLAWQAGQRAIIGVEGDRWQHNNEFTLKFRAFKLNDSRLNPSHREDIQDLVGIDGTGRVIIKDAVGVRDIFVKVWNPASMVSKNWIGFRTYNNNHPIRAHSAYGAQHELILNDLNEASISQGYVKEGGDEYFRASYTISGGRNPDASVDIAIPGQRAGI